MAAKVEVVASNNNDKQEDTIAPKTPLLVNLLGWYGAAAIAGAYMLVSFDWVSGDGWIYQLLNLTGALSLLTMSWFKKVHQNVILNIFWAGIGFVAILNLLHVF